VKLNRKMICDRLKFSCFFTTVTLLLTVMTSTAHSQDCGTGKLRQARTDSLRQSGIAVLNAIAQKNTEGLLHYVDSAGIALGPDKTPLSQVDLRNQFTRKNGAYCLFFSTACIPEMGRINGLEPDEILSKWKISYFEWLRLNKTYTTRASVLDDIEGIGGCDGEFHAQARREMKNAPDDIELDFNFYKGRWWLSYTVNGPPI